MFNLSKPTIDERAAAARLSLTKNGGAGLRAAVYLVIDYSGSMKEFFRDGTVQDFAERILALSRVLDDDGVVPVIFFDTAARTPVPVNLSNHVGAVKRIQRFAGNMGGTRYVPAMRAVLDAHAVSADPQGPALVIFQTDGAPGDADEVSRLICRTAATSPIFWQFVGFGDEGKTPPGEGARFDYLRRLSDLAVPAARPVDNAGFFAAGPDPAALGDAALYDAVTAEFPDWLVRAHALGVVRYP